MKKENKKKPYIEPIGLNISMKGKDESELRHNNSLVVGKMRNTGTGWDGVLTFQQAKDFSLEKENEKQKNMSKKNEKRN